MRKFLSLIVVLMLAFNVKAQGLAITEAADFTFSDNGTEKTLFEVLDNGQHALLYFFNYQSEVSEEKAPIINGVYNSLGMNQEDVYLIGLDPANESILLNNWAVITDVKYPLVAKDKAYYISQTYGGQWGVMMPALILIAPNHDIILEEIWPITSADQVVGIINDNLADGDEGEDPETPVDPEIPVGLAAPANVVAITTETTVTLTWDAVDGATEYNIYTPSSFDSNVLGLTETSYTFEGLTAGTEYCFEISAVSATDESAATEACAKTQAEGEEPEIPVDPETPVGLAAPANVVATATSETTIVLTWDAVEGATEYNIYTPSSFDSNVLGLTETTYTFEGLTAGTKYCFEVSAVSATDESAATEACATTPAEGDDDDDPEYPEPTTVPDAPVINVYAENSGLIVIEWEAVETAIFYYVYHKGNLVGDGQVMGTEVEILVNPETEYCFTVTAVNTVGESEHSEEACATTPAEGEDPINPDSNIEVAENDFVIYPNPVNDRLYIETETEVKEVVVYDIFGRRQELSAVSHQLSAIDVSNLNSGIYFVKVVTSEGEIVKRFVKK